MKPSQNHKLLASDNASGVHPDVFQWLLRANHAHVPGYGSDDFTALALKAFRQNFGARAQAFMLGTGTGCNVLALAAITRSTDTIFCSDIAHLYVDECSAPERMTGCKLVGIPAHQGKLQPEDLARAVQFQDDPYHRNRAGVLSLSQATEYGSIYSLEEIRALSQYAHEHAMLVHMDGARLANAAVALDLSLEELSRGAGVDILSFGGTKNGLMMAEAVVVFDEQIAARLPAVRKQGMQLFSKHRFLAAQFIAYFENDLWRQNAATANKMAKDLAQIMAATPQLRLCAAPEVNMVFAQVPQHWVAPLQNATGCNIWDASRAELRFVTSFDTTDADLAGYQSLLQELAEQPDK